MFRRIHNIIGSEAAVVAVAASFGLGLATLTCNAHSYPDPDATDSVAVSMSPAQAGPSARVRAVYQACVRLPFADRPTYIARVLADPTLGPDDAERIRDADWLLRAPWMGEVKP